jgi:hypothetical protein
MRKKALLKKYGSRKNMYMILRETNFIQPFINGYGQEILINPVKHFLKQKPYKHAEMNRAMLDIAKKFTSYVESLKKENK